MNDNNGCITTFVVLIAGIFILYFTINYGIAISKAIKSAPQCVFSHDPITCAAVVRSKN